MKSNDSDTGKIGYLAKLGGPLRNGRLSAEDVRRTPAQSCKAMQAPEGHGEEGSVLCFATVNVIPRRFDEEQ
jgi:hypothetical protein